MLMDLQVRVLECPYIFFHPHQTQLTAADASSINVLEGHTNCIWSLSTPPTSQPLLASCSADATIKIWDTRIHSRSPLRASFTHPGDQKVVPTCVSWDWEGRGVVIGWESGGVEMWDVERGVASVKMLLSSDGMFLELVDLSVLASLFVYLFDGWFVVVRRLLCLWVGGLL